MDSIDYGLRKYPCGGCGRFLPLATDLSNRVMEMLANDIQARTSWIQAEAISRDIMQFFYRQHIGIGTLLWEAGRAHALCEVCMGTPHCINCIGCEVHNAK